MQVDFNAKNEYDMINNYKVMQDVFNKLGVEKVCKQHQQLQHSCCTGFSTQTRQHTSATSRITQEGMQPLQQQQRCMQ